MQCRIGILKCLSAVFQSNFIMIKKIHNYPQCHEDDVVKDFSFLKKVAEILKDTSFIDFDKNMEKNLQKKIQGCAAKQQPSKPCFFCHHRRPTWLFK